jgi:hypothetical protein
MYIHATTKDLLDTVFSVRSMGICHCVNAFTELLPSKVNLFSLQYSGFQDSCHIESEVAEVVFSMCQGRTK